MIYTKHKKENETYARGGCATHRGDMELQQRDWATTDSPALYTQNLPNDKARRPLLLCVHWLHKCNDCQYQIDSCFFYRWCAFPCTSLQQFAVLLLLLPVVEVQCSFFPHAQSGAPNGDAVLNARGIQKALLHHGLFQLLCETVYWANLVNHLLELSSLAKALRANGQI